MSSSKIYVKFEDKCEVSKDKHKDRRKMEYFREAINSTEGRKGKSNPPLGGVYKDVEVDEARKQFFLLLELSALRNFRHYSRHVLFL